MTKFKHVLVLILFILPMFVLAPSLVTGPNELSTTNSLVVDTALPAQFVEERLRVAVYVEDNTTLPFYASGGTITNNYASIILLLENEGYDVIPMSTQDILEHKLMVANFDAFVLVDQLPRENIVNLIMDYWLAGGGILSFESSLGFLYYHGMIVSPDYGNFGLLGVDVSSHWGYQVVGNFTVGARHSTAKDYQQFDTIIITENTTIHDEGYFDTANPGDFVPLLMNEDDPSDSVGFALDNTARRGGRIVQLPGNCSTIPDWEESIIVDSIDWLAPRPKGRILVDFTHTNWIGIDSWDPSVEVYVMNQWRDGLVNLSYTVDKLQTALTPDNLQAYDILVLPMSSSNFTTQEVEDVRMWVQDGGSLFVIADATTLGTIDIALNTLLSPFDITLNLTAGNGPFGGVVTPADPHPTHENCLEMEFGSFSYMNITGDAYPLWMYSGNIVAAGQEYGAGRIIAITDGNLATDSLGIFERDNFQYLMSVANWLSAATAKILVYADTNSNSLHPNIVPLNGPVAKALYGINEPFYMTSDIDYFNLSLYRDDWDMIVYDNNMYNTLNYQPHLIDFVEEGGKVIFNTWDLDVTTGTYFGVDAVSYYSAPPSVFLWELDHPIFNIPAAYSATTINTTLNIYGTEALNVTTYANATPLAGYGDGGVAIAIGAGGNVIFNGPTFVIYNNDTDDSTYPDNVELWTNQIAFLYYDLPAIDHPDDVTYMETETGNEITWTPIADAGAWEYVFSVNGTPVQGGYWTGGALTFNVDGVTESITEYELTVFDRLGYSVSDLVSLNVTEYVEPTTTTEPGAPLDPTLLIIIGVGAAVVIVIIIIVMKKKK